MFKFNLFFRSVFSYSIDVVEKSFWKTIERNYGKREFLKHFDFAVLLKIRFTRYFNFAVFQPRLQKPRSLMS